MRLYIAEKPSMARELAYCLEKPQHGEGFIKTEHGIVTWLVGHVLEQVPPEKYDPRYKNWRADDLPIVPKIWKLQVNPKVYDQFSVVKNLIAQADEIIHAGDPDREGQLLVDELLDFLGNTKPVKRILLNALDETSIKRANANLRDNADFFNLKQSALARARADWLIGMNLSRAYTLAARRFGHDEVFPIGRVKTPTLALVVRREREIQNFKPVDFFNIFAQFKHANGTFVAQWKPKPAGKKFGYTPQQVLDAAQSLYEKKFTTYPRSDCEYLPTSQFGDAWKILAHLEDTTDETLKNLAAHASVKIKSRAWNNSRITAHHAIIPTTKRLSGTLTRVEFNVYNLIASNYAVQFYPVHVYDETAVSVSYKGETFSARGRIVKKIGWREFYSAPTFKADDEISQNLPKLKTGDAVVYKNSELKKSVTKPPPRFTASSLVQGMKEIHRYVKNPDVQQQLKAVYGIGTESTRAAIIDDLISRGFLSFTGKKILQPTDKAFMLIDILPDEIIYPDATAIWEDKLHSMSEGEGTLEDFLAGQVKFTRELCKKAAAVKLKPADKSSVICPRCKTGVMVRRQRKSDGAYFWGCTNFPNCRMACDDKNGKPDFTGRI